MKAAMIIWTLFVQGPNNTVTQAGTYMDQPSCHQAEKAIKKSFKVKTLCLSNGK